MEEFNCVLTFVLDDPGKFWLSSHLFVICFWVWFFVLFWFFLFCHFRMATILSMRRTTSRSFDVGSNQQGHVFPVRRNTKKKKKKKLKEIKGKFNDLSTERSKKNKVFRGRTIL